MLRKIIISLADMIVLSAQEYRRAAHVLKGLGGAKTLFLRSYATYLAGEKRKDEERLEAAGPLGKSDAANRVSSYWQ